jgi:hypothetical protein
MAEIALAPDPTSLSEAMDIPPLTLKDYCDNGCGQVAYVRVEIKPEHTSVVNGADGMLVPVTESGQYIDFCAHHYHVNEVEIAVQGYRVLDERQRLIQAEKMYKGEI